MLTPDAGQDEVFDRVASDPVVGALDGVNGTVFAYGQTGSGKTYTITGGAERYVDRGIVPRAVSKLFSEMARRSDGATYEVTVSYVEVYNDQAYDLLCDAGGGDAADDKKTAAASGSLTNDDAFLPKVTLLEADDGVIHARGCSAHRAGSEEDALNLLFLGDVNRAVAETPMNLNSSRSHCVFTMTVERREPGALTVRRGKIHLVDLAGSERVGKTGVRELVTLREAKHINLSLHALEKVVVALSDGDPHVPYRDSVMTMLLKDSLGGNCRTAMVATVTPEFEHVFEGVSTCRFAMRIASVRNAPRVNEETDPKLVIAKLREENRALRQELKLARGDDDGRDALSESELAKLRVEVERFCDDDTHELDLGGSMLKIRAALVFFRELAVAARRGERGSLRVGGSGAPERSTVEGEAATASETARLADVVRRRDDEIKVLVAMLEKHTGARGRDAFAGEKQVAREEEEKTEAGTVFDAESPSLRESQTPAKPSTPEQSSPPRAFSQTRSFADRNAAFERFKRAHAARGAIEANKKTLREQYTEAKRLGRAVNASRSAIATMRTKIETARVRRAFFSDGIVTNAKANDGDDDRARDARDASGARGDSEEERALLARMDGEKRAYKNNFDALRDLKKEIEHVQSLLERSRGRVMRDFEDWFGEGSGDGKGGGGGGSAGAGDAGAGDAVPGVPGVPGVPSTGNAEADADIAAFYAARRKLLRSSRGSSSRGSSRDGSASEGAGEGSSR